MSFENKIINIIKGNISKEVDVNIESNLIEDLGVDSFDKIMIVSALEDEFKLNIDIDDFSDVVKVSDIIKKLEKFNK